MLPSPPLLNRAGFISRQRTLGVSLGNLHLPSNLSAVFHPSCYKQNQTGSYKFSKANSPWWSQPIHPLQPRGLPAAPAASCQPSPLPLKPTHSCLNPASSLLILQMRNFSCSENNSPMSNNQNLNLFNADTCVLLCDATSSHASKT